MKRIFLSFFILLSVMRLAGATDVVSSEFYVQDKMDGLADVFVAQESEKIVTYPNTNGVINEHLIKDDLGTSTSDTGIATAGGTTEKLNTKQGVIPELPATNVVMSCGNGCVSSKAIYDAHHKFTNALVDAETLNTAVIDAVNSELTCDSYDPVSGGCLLWRVNAATTVLPTSLKLNTEQKATNDCFRSLDGLKNENNSCRSSSREILGEYGNKSGLFGIVFPYGDVLGKSVCTNLWPSGQFATAEQNIMLDNEFAAQTGVGNVNNGKRCLCKIFNVAGTPVSSDWMKNTEVASTPTYCARNCASLCGSIIWFYDATRRAIFSTITTQ